MRPPAAPAQPDRKGGKAVYTVAGGGFNARGAPGPAPLDIRTGPPDRTDDGGAVIDHLVNATGSPGTRAGPVGLCLGLGPGAAGKMAAE